MAAEIALGIVGAALLLAVGAVVLELIIRVINWLAGGRWGS